MKISIYLRTSVLILLMPMLFAQCNCNSGNENGSSDDDGGDHTVWHIKPIANAPKAKSNNKDLVLHYLIDNNFPPDTMRLFLDSSVIIEPIIRYIIQDSTCVTLVDHSEKYCQVKIHKH